MVESVLPTVSSSDSILALSDVERTRVAMARVDIVVVPGRATIGTTHGIHEAQLKWRNEPLDEAHTLCFR